MNPTSALKLHRLYALAFGLFLGLCIWKFGNPVILDHHVSPPVTLSDYLNDTWPPHWVGWFLLPFVVLGAGLLLSGKFLWPRPISLWLLPCGWLGWQFLSAGYTEDVNLTTSTLWEFFGCVACYLLGALVLGHRRLLPWLLAGILAAFTFSLMRGVDQRLFEFPVNRQMLVDGQNSGWTNLPPEVVVAMKQDSAIITTNGMDIANPVILTKFANGRVNGTMVYPNALAGLILLLLPVSLVLAFNATRSLKPPIRFAVILLAIFLGGAAFFWTGSKLGWLIGLLITGLFLLRLDGSLKFKLFAVTAVLVLGLGIFAVRFHHYFANGATSVGARFDYWHAAVQTTASHPAFGTGPGTFQRPYARLKSPDAEMARLTHNDFLEQFSDSGLVGGLLYAAWVILALTVIGRQLGRHSDPLSFAIYAGLLGWFAQNLGEFGLYIPALAWTAFALLGCLVSRELIQFDKKNPAS
jgi:hypothetical protein